MGNLIKSPRDTISNASGEKPDSQQPRATDFRRSENGIETTFTRQNTVDHQRSAVTSFRSQAPRTTSSHGSYNAAVKASINQVGKTPNIVFPTPFDDIYTKSELQILLAKAKHFVRTRRHTMSQLNYFYRDKARAYYDDILRKKNNIMQVYRKDFHGDPKSPINGRLMGLFMSVNVEYRTDQPVYKSVYGERRLLLDPEKKYCQCPNLYFTDFYCVHKPHYVTLVMTRPGSDADNFCQLYLIKLDWKDNDFLIRRHLPYFDSTTYYVMTCGLWIEVFFTEDMNISEETKLTGPIFDVEMIGFRSGGSVGLRKNLNCDVCNLE